MFLRISRSPIRDGDEERKDVEGYAGHWFLKADSKANRPPDVCNRKGVRLTNTEEFYAGCYAIASVIACAYDQMGQRGVKFNLQSIIKMADGKQLGGKKSATLRVC